MKKQSFYFLMAGLLSAISFANPVTAAVPSLEVDGRAAITTCPTIANTAQVYHSDKIVFMIGQGNLQPIVAADFGALNALPRGAELDIKIRDNPNKVADLKGKLLFFLGAANTAGNRALVRITQVTYATAVCPKAP